MPALPGARELLGARGAGSPAARAATREWAVAFTVFADRRRRSGSGGSLADATTSGGLVVCVPTERASEIDGAVIGDVVHGRARYDPSAITSWERPGLVPQPAFKAGEPWRPHGGKVRLLRRSAQATMTDPPPARLRSLPSVDRLATAVARAELAARRRGDPCRSRGERRRPRGARQNAMRAARRVCSTRPGSCYTRTSEGRRSRPQAREAVNAAAIGYVALELDLGTGARVRARPARREPVDGADRCRGCACRQQRSRGRSARRERARGTRQRGDRLSRGADRDRRRAPDR